MLELPWHCLKGGIAGRSRLQYDVWGPTVNLASRIEGVAQPSELWICELTEQRIRQVFHCDSQGWKKLKVCALRAVFCLRNFVKGLEREVHVFSVAGEMCLDDSQSREDS